MQKTFKNSNGLSNCLLWTVGVFLFRLIYLHLSFCSGKLNVQTAIKLREHYYCNKFTCFVIITIIIVFFFYCT